MHNTTTGGGAKVRASIDGTDCRILEPTPFSTKWFSHKVKGPGVRYEGGVCICTGWIGWVNGPFPCGAWPDLKIAKERMFHCLDDGEKVIANGGYSTGGVYTIVPCHLNDEQRRLHSVIRACHEIINRRLKQWNILGGRRFRSKVWRHKMVFYAIEVITQIIIQEEGPPFVIENAL